MCARVECVVAVNADFTLPGTESPVGGVVRDGHLLKSPSPSHHQLLVGRNGALSAEQMTLSGRLVSTDLSEVAVEAVNSERGNGDTVVYTPTYGRRTGTNRFGAELVVDVVEPEGALELGATALVEMQRLRRGRGNSVIPAGGAVVSAHGAAADALTAMWRRSREGEAGRRALLRIEATPDAFQSVGGTPILLRDGRRWYDPAATDFVRGQHPRTVMAWDDDGAMWMITVDGRQDGHSEGLSIPGVTALAEWLGATDALNLDGGGSTTFSVAGEVVNSPSDRLVRRGGVWQIAKDELPGDEVRGPVERPVTTALALVPERGAAHKAADPLRAGRLDLPEPVRLTPPTEVDPASNPFDTLPALVAPRPHGPPDPRAVAVAVAALALAALTWGIVHARRGARAA
jgi:hypothetical protein